MLRLWLVVTCLMLAGCGLSPEWQARMAAQRAAQQEATDRSDDATCRGYGVQPGSQGYLACRMNIANNRATAAQVDAVNQQRQSEAMMATGAALLQH